ncbi:uncharacterized protein LOC135947507 [Cloeon dipterum]|uniref:uncharacterized protein LOC135947507 n=1 Tax=Cloeon dipterum TaxID=197152 RepID=UPI00321F6E11
MAQELDSLLRNGVQSIDMLGADKFIVLVGCTVSGKSTFLKFLLKDPTLNIIKNEQEDCIFTDGETTIGSEDCLTSKTLMPNLKKDEKTGFAVLDCAGFEDTRSEENDLIASFLNKMVLVKAKKIKLVIVESYDKVKLHGDRNAFMNVLSLVSGLLKYNYKSFKNSICLVVTKIFEPFKSDDALIRSVKIFFEKAFKSLEEKYGAQPSSEDKLREMEILRFLIANSQIGLFRRPTEVAENPWRLPALKENFKNFRKLVFEEVKFTPNNCGEFNIVVAPKTQIWIRGPLIENTIEDLKRLLASLADTIEKSIFVKLGDNGGDLEEKLTRIAELGELITVLLSSIQSPEDLADFAVKKGVKKETIQELRYQTKKTIFLFGVVERDESEIKNLIVGLNGGRDEIISKVKTLVETNRFIVNLAKNAESHKVRLANDKVMKLFNELDVSNFPLKMTHLCELGFNECISFQAQNLKQMSINQISDLKALYKKKNENILISKWDGYRLLFLGRYVFLSQVSKEINRSQVEQVVVATTQHLYIDCDLTLKHTHLSLIAPLIEIVEEKRVITLNGEDGVSHHVKQASASQDNRSGEDGLHGNAGFSSGSFTLIALDVLNSTLLEVRSKGGNGSDGQHGGAGRSASACEYPLLEDIDGPISERFSVNQYIIDHCKAKGYEASIGTGEWTNYFLLVVGFGRSQFNLTVKKNPDDKATDGGRGGNSGSLAEAGEMNLKVLNSTSLNNVSVTCSNGENGKLGKGGIAGSNAKGKSRKYKCMYCTYFVLNWKVTVDQMLDSDREYDYSGHVARDGRDGSINDEGNNLRYKYSEESLLPIEKIADSLNDFAAKHDFYKDRSFYTFKTYVQQNLGSKTRATVTENRNSTQQQELSSVSQTKPESLQPESLQPEQDQTGFSIYKWFTGLFKKQK